MAAAPAIEELPDDEHDDRLITGEAVALDLRPVSFVLRAAGAGIDLIAYVLGAFLSILLAVWLLMNANADSAITQAVLVGTVVFWVVVVPTAVETLSHGKSLGKLAIGARIVREDGGAIGFRHAFIRALTGIFEVFMTLGGGATLVALLNARSRRLGDLIAGTYSQYERVSKEVTPVFGVPVELIEWSRTADVARMPDALGRRISQYLAQASRLTPGTRERLGVQLANQASAFVSPVPGGSPEHFLAAVAVLRRDRELAALRLEQDRLSTLAPALTGHPHNYPER